MIRRVDELLTASGLTMVTLNMTFWTAAGLCKVTSTMTSSKMALITTATYDKKSGRVVDSRRVDSEGGSTFLLVVLGVLGTLNILFNMNICILLLSTIIRVSGEKL